MKSTVENSFPFNPGNTRQWAPGSPSPSLLEHHQCPIHPPKTPPPLCHATAQGPTMVFYWASQASGDEPRPSKSGSFLYFSTWILHSSLVGLLTTASLTSRSTLPLCLARGSSNLEYPLCSFLTTHNTHCSSPGHVQLYILLILAPISLLPMFGCKKLCN